MWKMPGSGPPPKCGIFHIFFFFFYGFPNSLYLFYAVYFCKSKSIASVSFLWCASLPTTILVIVHTPTPYHSLWGVMRRGQIIMTTVQIRNKNGGMKMWGKKTQKTSGRCCILVLRERRIRGVSTARTIEFLNVYINIFGKSNDTLEESTSSAIVW